MRKILVPIILGAISSASFISYAENLNTKKTSKFKNASAFVQIMQDHNQNNKLKSSNIKTIVNNAINNAYGVLEINKMKNNYANIRVKLIYDNNNLDHLLIIKNKKLQKGFELDKINLNDNTLIRNYKFNTRENKIFDAQTQPVCPDDSITFVISSYNYSDVQRKTFSSPALDEINQSATRAGFKVKTLYDNEATSQNIINYLSCPNVKAYHDTGDGNTNGWETFDGLITYENIQENLNGKLHNKIIYLNDCLVFNDPLKQTVISIGGAAAYLGGITELSTLTTDEAGACTWNEILENNTDVPLDKKSSICQNAYDYNPLEPSDGITGAYNKTGYYLSIPKPITELPWGSIVEGDLGDDLEGTKFGFVSNIQNGNNETDSYIATTTAYNKCRNSQGSHCDVPNNQVSFKYCASMVYNKKPYFGYSNNKATSQIQAIKACAANNYYIEDYDNCQNIISTVCNT